MFPSLLGALAASYFFERMMLDDQPKIGENKFDIS
jgi:hypothetical protein